MMVNRIDFTSMLARCLKEDEKIYSVYKLSSYMAHFIKRYFHKVSLCRDKQC